MEQRDIKTTVLLVRHGECQGNIEERFRGKVDFPLNETGLRQAEETGKAIFSFHPKAIYTSPLLRALSTAEAIASHTSAPLFTEEGFNNTSLGIWEGRLKKEIAVEYPEQWNTWLENPEMLSVEGAESMEVTQQRSLNSLNRIIKKHQGEAIVIVTHRTVIKPLLAGCLGIKSPYFWKTHMDTAAYSVMHFNKLHGYSLFSLNITDHLSSFTTEWI